MTAARYCQWLNTAVVHAAASCRTSGNNDITVGDTNVEGLVSIRTGRGNDTIRGGQRDDAALADGEADADGENGHATWGAAHIFDAGGANDIVLRNLAISGGGLTLRTAGRGRDSIRLIDIGVRGETDILTGGGRDRLAIVDSVFGGPFALDMEWGDDVAHVTGSTFEGPTEMLGGPGEDMLSETDNTFLGTFFEDFEL